MGLIYGTIPFLLKEMEVGSTSSYSDLGLVALASQPYNFKFLWSPLVDSIYDKRIGRRKSWIIPMLTLASLCFIYAGFMAEDLFSPGKELQVLKISGLFGLLAVICATQDVAIDGWALTLLDRDYLQSASTCQTIGHNLGYYTAFTIYLSLASSEFCNKYFSRTSVALDFGQFLLFCGTFYIVAMFLVTRMSPENIDIAPKPGSIKMAYRQMFKIMSLSSVKTLLMILLLGKIGYMAGETLMPLKLLDKGFPKETLSITMLVDFAVQICLSWLAINWAAREHPLRSWQLGCLCRILMSLFGIWIVAAFPVDGEISTNYVLLVQLHTVVTSFASTIMHVSLSSFFSIVGDPAVGGTYLTLLSTFSNLGSSWPRLLSLAMVDRFTRRICTLDPSMASNLTGPFSDACDTAEAYANCTRLGGKCGIVSDGYYVVVWLSILLGLLVMHLAVRPLIWRAQSVPISSWRIIM